MQVIAKAGTESLATVYVAKTTSGKMVEFCESVQPPLPREKKWVLLISCLYGCPVKCRFCDAGGNYRGRLTADEIIFQINYLIGQRYPNGRIPSEKFKIQFARMGEPSLNFSVLETLRMLPKLYNAPRDSITYCTE
jgi:23S rRNA (adenine2503-C2)-methyltransferase